MNVSGIGSELFGIYEGSKGSISKSFAQLLKDAVDSVNKYQMDYDALINRQIAGEDVNLHDIIIAGEKAQLSLELALQIRNKAIEAYQEIMRMQV